MKLVLVGYMGSGKSTLGKALSQTLSVPFLDLDAVIEEKEGRSIQDIFQSKGEIYFRKQEASYLNQVLKNEGSLVLSLGGGTPCYGTIMQDLHKRSDVTTIYLKASVDLLTERLWPERAHRPLIAHLQEQELLNDFIRKHLFERKFYYMQADLTVEVDGKEEKELLEEIVMRLF